MSYISEKVSYLDGLSDGMGIEKDEKYGKLLKGIIEALGAIAEELDEHDEYMEDLSDCVDDLYDEIEALDDAVFEDDDEEDDGFYEVDCPNCGETVYVDEEMLDSEDGLICPNCNSPIELDLDECEEGCCCHCDEEK